MKSIPYTLPIWMWAALLLSACYGALHYYYLLLVLMAFGNKLFGEFNESELKKALQYFHTSPAMRRVKLTAAQWFVGCNMAMGWLLVARQHGGWELAALVVSVGLANGSFLLTLAHDLSHEEDGRARWLSKALLTILCFPFFLTDHLYGHHVLVGTSADGSTARRGEGLYRFIWRSARQRVWRTYSSQTDLPPALKDGLLRSNRRFTLWLLVAGTALYAASPVLCWAWLGQAAVAIFTYECTNYIQHYGLARKVGDPVGMAHSWNSYRKYAAWYYWFLFVHSPHHAETVANREHPKQGPVFPFPVLFMLLLALVPPLWFRAMGPALDKLGDGQAHLPTAKGLGSPSLQTQRHAV